MPPAAIDLTLVPVGAGALALTHRPKAKALPSLRAAGLTHLVTLLAEREGAPAVGAAAREAGLEWVWVELPNAQQPSADSRERIAAALTALAAALDGGARIAVHCSAGIHRTGMVGYALLRTCGLTPDDAATTLNRLRAATAEGVGADRLVWAEELAQAALLRSAPADRPAD